jgi:hypothetical protein
MHSRLFNAAFIRDQASAAQQGGLGRPPTQSIGAQQPPGALVVLSLRRGGMVDRGITPRYDYTRQGVDDVSYRSWREHDVEDTIRFNAPRERELGTIKSSPNK